MTISTTGSRISYSGNGVTTSFSFPYKFLADGDLVVILVDADGTETTQVLTTNYTVSGAGVGAGGTVTMLVAPSATQTLVIYRELDITQETDYITGDSFPAETHEAALDKLTMIAQQHEDSISRTLRLSDGSPLTAQILPIPVADSYLRWNSTATELINQAITADPSNDAVGIAYIPAGTGAVTTNVQSKLRESVSVKDFGAVGDGVTDDTAAIQAALDAVSKINDKHFHLIFPAGQYKVSDRLWLPFANGDYQRYNNVLIEGYGAELIGSGSSDTDHDCFESAYWASGVKTTTIGTPAETRLTYGLLVKGITFKDFRRCFYLQNWNQGTGIEDVYSNNCQAMIEASRCFYMKVEHAYCMGAPTADTKPAFKFSNFANIQPISGLKSSNHATVIELSGTDGLTLRDCALEDCTDGIVISGECKQLTLDTFYIEGCSNSGIRIDSVVRQLKLSNSFINQTANLLFDASALTTAQYASVIVDNCRIESGDMTIDDNIFITHRNSPLQSVTYVEGTNPKIYKDTPTLTYDTSVSGYDGPMRFVEDNSVAGLHAGKYDGSFGDVRLNSSNKVQSGTVISASNPLTIDFDIDVKQNLFCSVLLEYSHSTGTDELHFFVVADGTSTPTLEVFRFTSGAIDYPTALVTVSDNGSGKLRVTTAARSNHSLINAIARLI